MKLQITPHTPHKKSIIWIIFVCVSLSFASCHSGMSTKEAEKSLSAAFHKKTGYTVLNVSLIKISDYKFEGYINYDLFGNSMRKDVTVTVDMDNPSEFIWRYDGDLYH